MQSLHTVLYLAVILTPPMSHAECDPPEGIDLCCAAFFGDTDNEGSYQVVCSGDVWNVHQGPFFELIASMAFTDGDFPDNPYITITACDVEDECIKFNSSSYSQAELNDFSLFDWEHRIHTIEIAPHRNNDFCE